MAMHQWQIQFDESADIVSAVQLPDPPTPKKRTITVWAETKNQAKRKAEELYSLAT